MDISIISEKTYNYISSTNGKTFAIFTITILLVIFFIVFAIRPTVLKIVQIQAEYSANEEFLEKLKTKNDNLDTLADQFNDEVIRPKLDLFSKIVPTKIDTEEIILNLSTLATNDGLKVVSVNTNYDLNLSDSELNLSTKIKKYKISFNLNGSAEGFNKYIEKVTNYPRAMTVSNIGMTKSTEGNYIYRFDLTAYYLPNE